MTRLLLALLAGLALALVACGGDDDDTLPGQGLGSITPVGTKDTTPTAAPDGDGGVPDPVDPSLDEELTEVARGDLIAAIAPASVYDLDPETLAADAGATPSCDNLQFDISWQVTDPYPPEGVVLAFQIERNDAPINVATGAVGNTAVGCGLLRVANQGSAPITVAMKYLIGALQ